MSDGDGGMRLAGIVSWGFGCARPEYAGIYARVQSFYPFMNDALGGGAPVAVIEASHQKASLGREIALEGASSYDLGIGRIVDHSWTQTKGPAVALSRTATGISFVAPSAVATLEFQLEVTDDRGETGRESIQLQVAYQRVAPSTDESADVALGDDNDGSGGCSAPRRNGTAFVLLTVLFVSRRRRKRRQPRGARAAPS